MRLGNGEFYNGDCFDVMPTIPAGSVDMILADLPYGTTQNKWDRVNKFTDALNAKKRPMRRHEDICVFYVTQPTYNPQKTPVTPYKSRRSKNTKTGSYGSVTTPVDYGTEISEINPSTVITIDGHFTSGVCHPTQKPVALFEYLIRTYTNEGETVLDNTAGSGTTAIAAHNTGRRWICIERDENYYWRAIARCIDAGMR